MNWQNLSTDRWPDWKDTGKPVRLLMPDGREVEGILEADEFFDGEDEMPIFSVNRPDGSIVSFADCEKFTFDLSEGV